MSHSPKQITTIQAGAAAGNPADTVYLHPVQEVRQLAPNFGFRATFRVYPQVPVEITYGAKPYRVSIAQPVRQGPTGIWVISRIFPEPNQAAPAPPGLTVGVISHAAATLQAIQAGADGHNPAYTWYLDPSQVLWQAMPKYGFTGPITVRSLVVTLDYQGKLYDFVLKQLAKQGPKGIWLITKVRQFRRP